MRPKQPTPAAEALAVVTIISVHAIVSGSLMIWLGIKAKGIRTGGMPAMGAN